MTHNRSSRSRPVSIVHGRYSKKKSSTKLGKSEDAIADAEAITEGRGDGIEFDVEDTSLLLLLLLLFVGGVDHKTNSFGDDDTNAEPESTETHKHRPR